MHVSTSHRLRRRAKSDSAVNRNAIGFSHMKAIVLINRTTTNSLKLGMAD
jgi:hypothetical protein